MHGEPGFDVSFDFRTDVPVGKDPDEFSARLRATHRLLWSRPLNSGTALELVAPSSRRKGYLLNAYPNGPELCFGSDAITNSYTTWIRPRTLVNAIAELDEHQRLRYLNPAYTVGSTMIWPVRTKDQPTINQARGTRSEIADRIDLTLECVRLHYAGDSDSPLADVFHAYRDFFSLFADFSEFITFFHFQDLVTDDHTRVEFFLPFDGFDRPGTPQSTDEYITYREATVSFIEGRERLISDRMTRVQP
ncbi:DUF6994 family protein [Homoserinimonas sp. A520]